VKTLTPLNHAIRNFSQTNITSARKGKTLNNRIVKQLDIELLLEFANEAQNDVEEFKKKLEAWFNETMDRVSGWYQRKIKLITLGIGFVVTILFNVDSIKIYKILSTNNKVRGEVIVAAAGYLDKTASFDVGAGSATAEKFKELLCEQIDPTVNVLGIGWPYDQFQENMKLLSWSKVFGWVLTIIAISLGAPFWFDLLNKVMNLRGTGKPVETSDPKPQPVG
jgi:hypothetical protein